MYLNLLHSTNSSDVQFLVCPWALSTFWILFPRKILLSHGSIQYWEQEKLVNTSLILLPSVISVFQKPYIVFRSSVYYFFQCFSCLSHNFKSKKNMNKTMPFDRTWRDVFLGLRETEIGTLEPFNQEITWILWLLNKFASFMSSCSNYWALLMRRFLFFVRNSAILFIFVAEICVSWEKSSKKLHGMIYRLLL